MIKDKPILKSILWTFVILIFPVVSGVITQVLMMNNIQTMFIQGCFMLISLIIPIVYICKFKISFKKIGLIKIENGSAKKVLFFLPLVIAEAPFLLVGIRLNSIKYIITLLFFTLAVGISEEIYFRGIILKLLEEKYPPQKSIIISALVFGIIAAEIITITKSLIPIIIWHFVFNFVNYITLATGVNEIFVIGFQEIIMIIYAYNLWSKISLKNKDILKL